MSITIGADPEMFLIKDGKFYPVIGLLGGTKEHPKKAGIGAVQEDNVMAEFNIPPATSADAFSSSIKQMIEVVETSTKRYGCSLAIVPYATFDYELLKHPQATHMGCDPDFNAWEGDINPRPSIEEIKNIRTASGHVHIGTDSVNERPDYRMMLVRACDMFLGVPSILLDSDPVRRRYYGKAGAFRPKPYGIEYRVLSNFWISTDRYRKWVFKQAVKAASAYLSVGSILHKERKIIQEIINSHDFKGATKFCEKYGISLPEESVK